LAAAPARATAAAGLAAAVLALLGGCGSSAPAATPRMVTPASSDASNPADPSAGAGSPPDSASLSPSGKAQPSAGAPAPASSPLDLRAVSGKTILVDPGHNGGNWAHPEIINQLVPMGTGSKACDTTGTQTNSGYQEAAFTFDVGTRLVALLRSAGAKGVMTRESNAGIGA